MSSLQALFASLEEEEKEEGGPPAPPASTPLLHEPQPPSLGPQDLAPPPPPSYGTLQNLFVPLDVDEPPSIGAPAAGSQTPRSHHNRRTSFVESGEEEEELVTEDLRERWDPYVDAEPVPSPPSSHSVSVTWPIPVRAASPQHGGITSIEIEPLGTTDTAVTNSPGGSRSSSSPLAVQVKQLGIDCLGGVMGFLLVLVNFLCFALVTCCVPRMRENMPAVLQMLALGTTVVGLCAVTSKIPYYLVVPDLFVCPFYIAVVRTLDSAIPQSQSDELFPTFLVVAMVMVTFFGALLVAAMKLRLLRVGDYTPFPVVQGLLAAIGVGLARSCLIVQQGAASSLGVNDFMWLCVSVGIVAVLFSLELGFHKPLGTIYIPVYFSAMLLFYVLLFLVGAGDLERGIDWADSKHAFLLSATLSEEGEGGGFNVWTADILSGAISKVNWAAAAQCTGTVFSFWVLELLKVTVQFPETLKVVGTKMSDKALEREVSLLGWATVVSGLFGSYSAIPAIAPMSVIYETFEGKTLPRTKAPNIICTACVAVVFFYGFAVVRVIPKFVFSAMLLHTAVVILWHRVVVSVQKLEWNEGGRLLSIFFHFIIIPPISNQLELIVRRHPLLSPLGLVIIIIVAVSVVTGSTMNAIACGAMCSVLLFVYQWHTLGCIKYASSGVQEKTRQNQKTKSRMGEKKNLKSKSRDEEN
jgi:MFS superfamily sulfate permease-like transporter